MIRSLASLLVIVASVAHAEVKLPQGWRRPAAAQNVFCIEKGDDPYRVVGDFDGDGRQDEARLLAKNNRHFIGLWVWMGDREPQLILHWELEDDGQHKLGIHHVSGPDAFETWCGRSGQCQPGEPERVSWSYESINLYWCESSSQLVWWDAKRERFRTAWMSD